MIMHHDRHSGRIGRRDCGGAGVAMVIMLVVLQLMVVGSLLGGGTREQDVTVQRLDGLRSQYCADAVLNMAIREVCRATDEDGDGVVGSIAAGVVGKGPALNGARAAAKLDVTGPTFTITVHSTGGLCQRAFVTSIVSESKDSTPLSTYATSGSPVTPVVRQFDTGAWGPAASIGALAANASWIVLRNSPSTAGGPDRAVIALGQNGALAASTSSSGSWSAPSTLATGTGTVNTRVFAADFEGRTGNLMVVYRKGSNTNLFHRTYDVPSPAEQSFSLSLTSAPTWLEIAPRPGNREMVLAAAAGSNLRAAIWDGSAWGNAINLESSLPTAGRPFHVAYMNKSGKAMVVWTPTSGNPRYATWDGNSWSGVSTLPAIAGAVPAGWVTLEGHPLKSSDEVLLACIGADTQISVNTWNGASWGSNVVVETSAASSTQPQVDVCYQPNGAAALLVWHRSGQDALRYRTRSTGAWSATQTGPDMATPTATIRLERGREPAEVMMLARRDAEANYAAYNAWSNANDYDLGTVNITGPIGSVAGSLLPPPPAATAGSTNISPSSGTVAPGVYGSMSQSGTVTFTAGTYVFSSVTVNGTLRFDTSAGPIYWNITTGGLSGDNGNTFTNTGNGTAQINVINGDFSLKNNTVFNNIDIIVYNGDITLKNNTDGAVGLYCSGTLDIKNNGTINMNATPVGAAPICSTVLWTSGSPGPRIDLNTSCSYAGVTDPCDLAGSPLPQGWAIESWTAIEP